MKVHDDNYNSTTFDQTYHKQASLAPSLAPSHAPIPSPSSLPSPSPSPSPAPEQRKIEKFLATKKGITLGADEALPTTSDGQ